MRVRALKPGEALVRTLEDGTPMRLSQSERRRGRARLGIEAPASVKVRRGELILRRLGEAFSPSKVSPS